MRFLVVLLCVLSFFGCKSAPAPAPELEETTDPAPTPAPIPQAQKPVPPALAVIIYVTEVGARGGPKRPGAVIFSSDPDSKYLQERPRPTRVLKPMDKTRMGQILSQLAAAGLDRLPVEKQLVDDAITPERQIIILRDGDRVSYRLGAAKTDSETLKTFNACERVLVDASHERDEYVETFGSDQTDRFKPLNPNR